MDVFINECSLHEQFADQNDFDVALQIFFQVVNRLLTVRIEHPLYQRSDLFYVYKAIRNKAFIASLNAVREKDLRVSVRNVLHNKLNARDWTQERVHSANDVFTCKEDLVTDTSMAELAERILCHTTESGLLINFPESRFRTETSVIVEKNEDSSAPIDCVDQKQTLELWLDKRLQLSKFEYDIASRTPPIDSQTVLRDRGRFERTQLPRQGGRILYRERKTQYIWYVDSFHFGEAAHIEVFDQHGLNHIGEACIVGILDTSRRNPSKRISL